MQGVPAVYLGRIVDKQHFRTFIYSPNGSQKLVESWDEYERHMETGLWFASVEDAKAIVVEEQTKAVRNKPAKAAEEKYVEVVLDEPFVAVPKDDFLPKGSKK